MQPRTRRPRRLDESCQLTADQLVYPESDRCSLEQDVLGVSLVDAQTGDQPILVHRHLSQVKPAGSRDETRVIIVQVTPEFGGFKGA